MRPLLPFSLFLFICLISAAPLSSSSSDCKRFNSCGNDLTKTLNSRSSSSHQSLPPLNPLLQFDKPIPKVKTTVEELVSTEDKDTPSKVVSSSESTYIQSVVYATAQYPGQNRNNSSQQDYQLNASRKDSEPLVVGIVAFFIIALIVLEIVSKSGHLRMAFYRLRRSCRLSHALNDEEWSIALGETTQGRALSQEKKVARKRSQMLAGKSSFCCDNRSSRCMCCERNESSISAVISNCIRGVCEV